MFLDERRRFVRVVCNNVIEFSCYGQNSEQFYNGSSYCGNVSLGGILFFSKNEIKVGTHLKIKFHLGSFKKSLGTVIMDGKVVRVKKNEHSGRWEIGATLMPDKNAENNLRFFNWLAEKDEQYFLVE